MPTPKPKNLTPPRRSLWHGKKFWLILVPVLLIVGGVTAEAIRHNQNRKAIEADRARFVQADKDVQAVAAEIVAKLGPPLKQEYENGCSRPSAKWEETPLTCDTGSSLFYSIDNTEQANSINTRVKEIASSSWSVSSTSPPPTISLDAPFTALTAGGYNKQTDYQSSLTRYDNASAEIKCDTTSIFYLATHPPFDDFFASDQSTYMLAITIDCQDRARAEHFRLRI